MSVYVCQSVMLLQCQQSDSKIQDFGTYGLGVSTQSLLWVMTSNSSKIRHVFDFNCLTEKSWCASSRCSKAQCLSQC